MGVIFQSPIINLVTLKMTNSNCICHNDKHKHNNKWTKIINQISPIHHVYICRPCMQLQGIPPPYSSSCNKNMILSWCLDVMYVWLNFLSVFVMNLPTWIGGMVTFSRFLLPIVIMGVTVTVSVWLSRFLWTEKIGSSSVTAAYVYLHVIPHFLFKIILWPL